LNTTVNLSSNVDELAAIDSSKEARVYTDVLFVNPNGSNGDGKSWDNAINNLYDALQLCSTNDHDMTLLLLSTDNNSGFDINISGDPLVSANVEIRGVGMNATKIVNNHSGATSILKFTKIGNLSNIAIICGTGSDGIIYTGSGVKGSTIESCYIDSSNMVVGRCGLKLESGCSHVLINDLRIFGNSSNSTGISIQGATSVYMGKIDVLKCKTGIHGFDSNNNYIFFYEKCMVKECNIGVKIDDGDKTCFESVCFYGNTSNVNLSGGNVVHFDQNGINWSDYYYKIIPNNVSSGITIQAGSNNGEDGEWTNLITGSDTLNPFKVSGVYVDNPSDANTLYGLKLAFGDSNTEFCQTFFHGAGGRRTLVVDNVNSPVFTGGTLISAKLQSANGGSDSCKIWLQYITI